MVGFFIEDLMTPYIMGREDAINANQKDMAKAYELQDAGYASVEKALDLEGRLARQRGHLAASNAWSNTQEAFSQARFDTGYAADIAGNLKNMEDWGKPFPYYDVSAQVRSWAGAPAWKDIGGGAAPVWSGAGSGGGSAPRAGVTGVGGAPRSGGGGSARAAAGPGPPTVPEPKAAGGTTPAAGGETPAAGPETPPVDAAAPAPAPGTPPPTEPFTQFKEPPGSYPLGGIPMESRAGKGRGGLSGSHTSVEEEGNLNLWDHPTRWDTDTPERRRQNAKRFDDWKKVVQWGLANDKEHAAYYNAVAQYLHAAGQMHDPGLFVNLPPNLQSARAFYTARAGVPSPEAPPVSEPAPPSAPPTVPEPTAPDAEPAPVQAQSPAQAPVEQSPAQAPVEQPPAAAPPTLPEPTAPVAEPLQQGQPMTPESAQARMAELKSAFDAKGNEWRPVYAAVQYEIQERAAGRMHWEDRQYENFAAQGNQLGAEMQALYDEYEQLRAQFGGEPLVVNVPSPAPLSSVPAPAPAPAGPPESPATLPEPTAEPGGLAENVSYRMDSSPFAPVSGPQVPLTGPALQSELDRLAAERAAVRGTYDKHNENMGTTKKLPPMMTEGEWLDTKRRLADLEAEEDALLAPTRSPVELEVARVVNEQNRLAIEMNVLDLQLSPTFYRNFKRSPGSPRPALSAAQRAAMERKRSELVSYFNDLSFRKASLMFPDMPLIPGLVDAYRNVGRDKTQAAPAPPKIVPATPAPAKPKTVPGVYTPPARTPRQITASLDGRGSSGSIRALAARFATQYNTAVG